jgi:hypothetical protein
MCNLYSITTNQAAIIALFRVINRYVGNLPPMTGVFPDYPAPVIRNIIGAWRQIVLVASKAAARVRRSRRPARRPQLVSDLSGRGIASTPHDSRRRRHREAVDAMTNAGR